jgi:hypothetical protein
LTKVVRCRLCIIVVQIAPDRAQDANGFRPGSFFFLYSFFTASTRDVYGCCIPTLDTEQYITANVACNLLIFQ